MGVAVVSSCDSAKILEAPEHALDGVSPAVEEGREAALPDPVGLGRDVGHCARGFEYKNGIGRY